MGATIKKLSWRRGTGVWGGWVRGVSRGKLREAGPKLDQGFSPGGMKAREGGGGDWITGRINWRLGEIGPPSELHVLPRILGFSTSALQTLDWITLHCGD